MGKSMKLILSHLRRHSGTEKDQRIVDDVVSNPPTGWKFLIQLVDVNLCVGEIHNCYLFLRI